MSEEFKDVKKLLSYIQRNLKAPKGQTNKFGGYKYRSCEDILEAVKKLLPNGAFVICQDELMVKGDRYYVLGSAQLSYKNGEIFADAYAREPEDKKGMDASQITGMASSYARKYALNGLFAIDDTKDADTQDNSEEAKEQPKEKPKPVDGQEFLMLIGKVQDAQDEKELKAAKDNARGAWKRLNAKMRSSITAAIEAKEAELDDIPDFEPKGK